MFFPLAPMTVRPAEKNHGVPVPTRLAAVVDELSRIVVGKDTPLKLALACLLARGHLLIEDIPDGADPSRACGTSGA